MNSTMDADVSYCIGLNIGDNLRQQGLGDIEIENFISGLRTLLSDEQPKFSPQQANQIIQEFFEKKTAEQFEGFKVEGEQFLKENATREGVIETASGLQYEIIEEGVGQQPESTSMVSVHYHGTLINGTVFDSSYERGEPAQFPLNQVISGWTEGLQLMKEGSKFRFYIPQHLAYGANPHPNGPIKPFMTLVFDVELLSVLS
jgi:FKBP-type peptidyl-prolyl cis-trans isomerase FklB